LAGEAYYAGYPAIWFAGFASMGLGLSDLGSSGSLVSNNTRLIARNQCIAAAAGLILNVLLVPSFGFMGAAFSGAVAFTLLAALQAISSARFLTWRWPLSSLWRVLTASAAMAVSVFLIQAGLRSDMTIWQIVDLLLSITVGALVYGLVLWMVGEVSPSKILDFLRVDRRQPAINQVANETGQK
jgi:O-antigen/teichoic acid export membrane protein